MPMLTMTQIAELTGTSWRTVRKRCELLPGVPGPKNATLYDSRTALLAVLDSRSGDGSDLEYERIRLTRAQAALTELQVIRLRETLLPAELVAQAQNALRAAYIDRSQRLIAELVPVLLRVQREADAQALIQDAIHAALDELAEFDITEHLTPAVLEVEGAPVGAKH